MKYIDKIFYLATIAAVLTLCGCATPNDGYTDEEEYSSMPWNTPQSWEAGPSLPGLSGPGY